METTKIIDGDYKEIKDVVVQITTEKTEVKIDIVETNEDLLLKTIDVLNAKKVQVIANIDAEIAINQKMLDTIIKIDRQSAVILQDKIIK